MGEKVCGKLTSRELGKRVTFSSAKFGKRLQFNFEKHAICTNLARRPFFHGKLSVTGSIRTDQIVQVIMLNISNLLLFARPI